MDHIFGHRRLGDLDSKLQEFTVDARRAPTRIVPADGADQVPDLEW